MVSNHASSRSLGILDSLKSLHKQATPLEAVDDYKDILSTKRPSMMIPVIPEIPDPKQEATLTHRGDIRSRQERLKKLLAGS